MYRETFARGAGEPQGHRHSTSFEAYLINQHFQSVTVYCVGGQIREYPFRSFEQDIGDLSSPLLKTFDEIGQIAMAIHGELYPVQKLEAF